MKLLKVILVMWLIGGATFAESTNAVAYVKWGDSVLVSVAVTGETSSVAVGGYTKETNSQYYSFTGQADVTTEYRNITIDMTGTIIGDLLYTHQIVGGAATITDTLWVAGLTSTGLICYTAGLKIVSICDYASVSPNYSIVQNGVNSDLYPILEIGYWGSAYYEVIYRVTNPVVFGTAFDVSMSAACETDVLAGDPYRYRGFDFTLTDVYVLSAEGLPLEGQYTVVSRNGNLAPQSSQLFMQFNEGEPMVTWHSITSRTYQTQYTTNLVDSSWQDIGSVQQGTGTSNWVVVSNSAPSGIYRVVEQ